MANEVDAGEFWLPSEFLTEEEVLTGFRTQRFRGSRQCGVSRELEDYLGFFSDLRSPVAAANGSIEPENDEDDFISGLAWSFRQASLQSSEFQPDYTAKGWKMYGSPNSTLCGCEPRIRWACPNCRTHVLDTTVPKTTLGWDLLHVSAEEVARARLALKTSSFESPKPGLDPPPFKIGWPVTSPFYPYKSLAEARLSYFQLQASQFQRMKQQRQQITKADFHARPPEVWRASQQSISGIRAVLGSDNGLKKERNGTGVFLPRRLEHSTAEIRKKQQAASPTALPGKVVHSLNATTKSPREEYDAASASSFTHNRTGPMISQQRILPSANQEIRLPQDWTY